MVGGQVNPIISIIIDNNNNNNNNNDNIPLNGFHPGRGTPLKEAARDVPLDGVMWTFSSAPTWEIGAETPPGGGTWVNVCWVCAAGLSEPLPHYSLFFGQL